MIYLCFGLVAAHLVFLSFQHGECRENYPDPVLHPVVFDRTADFLVQEVEQGDQWGIHNQEYGL